MHAYLLTGTDEEKIKTEAQKIAKAKNAKLMPFDVVKISDVRELSKFTNLKISNKTAIYIKGIDKATTEALNAFLKNLEEPQEDLFYILTAKSENNLLETIVSRCQIIRTCGKKVSDKSLKKVKKFLELREEEKLVFIKKLRKRDDSLNFLDEIIFNGHELLKNKEKKSDLANLLKAAEETKRKIEAYGNPSLQLTNFVLQVE